MEVGARHSVRRDINVTPMIDVMLVLLVVYMVAMQFRFIFDVQVPPPKDTRSSTGSAIVLELRADGSYALNETGVRRVALPARLRALYADGRRQVLYVKATPARPYRDVIDVVDMANGAGVQVIGYMP